MKKTSFTGKGVLRLTVGVFAVFFSVVFLAQTAYAANGPSSSKKSPGIIYIGETHAGGGYILYSGNTGKKTASRGGFKYTKSNNTLTLNKLGDSENYYLIVQDMGNDFKVVVNGKNTLGYIGVYSTVNDRMGLTITGRGTLIVNPGKNYGAAITADAHGKSNTKITIDNTVNVTLYGGKNIFTNKKEQAIEIRNAKYSKTSAVLRMGGKKTGSTKVTSKKVKGGYNYSYGGSKLTIKKSGNSFLGSSKKTKAKTKGSNTGKKQTNKGKIYVLVYGGEKPNSDKNVHTVSRALKQLKVPGYTLSKENIVIINKKDFKKKDFDTAVKTTFKTAGKNDLCFVYLNTHSKVNEYKDKKTNKTTRITIPGLKTGEGENDYYSWKQVLTYMGDNIKGKIIFMTEVCNSGKFITAVEKTKVKDRIVILTAAHPKSPAKELPLPIIGGGYYTNALSAGLKKGLAADNNKDGKVTIFELWNYIKNNRDIKDSGQSPWYYCPKSMKSFVIYKK